MKLLRLITAFLVASSLQAGVSFALEDGILEHLSGPGPFFRFGFEYRALCVSQPAGTSGPTASWLHPYDRGAALDVPAWGHAPKGTDARALAHQACARDQDVKAYVAFSYGHYFSVQNNLFPDNLDDKAFKVKAESAGARFMTRIHPAVDVGIGASVFWFHGQAFSSFARFTLEPVRLSVAPFAALSDSPRAKAFRFTVAPTILFGTVDQDDFCNTSACTVTPRQFSSQAETIWASTITIDVFSLVGRNK